MSRDLELVVLMGLQASGKTTFRQTQFDRTHVVVSKDLFRNHRKPQKRQIQLIEAALRNHQSVVVDNTNPRVEDRLALIEIARRFDVRVRGFFFWSLLSESVARNSMRVGKSRVPDIGLFATAKVLRRPSYAEGFDELYLVRIAAAQEFVVEPYTEECCET
jgi:predicted kinase